MAHNIDGYTQLEALQENLEIMRTQNEVGSRVLNLSDRFNRYLDRSVLSLLAVRTG